MQIGPYATDKIIEQYGAATVYSARQEFTRQPVLFTLIVPASTSDRALWETRLNAVKTLKHPNIVPLLDSDQTGDGHLYAVTPRLPTAIGTDTSDVFTPNEALLLATQVSAALDYAHGQGRVHGLLRRLHVLRLENGDYAVRGFELGAAQPKRSPRHDVAALARIIYRALVGQDLNPGSAMIAGLPAALNRVLRAAIGSGSYKTASDFLAALRDAIESLPADQRDQPLEVARLLQASGKRQPDDDSVSGAASGSGRWLIVLALVLLFGVIGGGYFLTTRRAAPMPDAVLVAPTSTGSPLPTETAAPTSTPTLPPSATATLTPTASSSPTITNTATATATPSLTRTPSATPTATVTRAPTWTPRPTDTPSATPAPDALVTAKAGVILRTGPGQAYFAVTTLKLGTALRITSRTDDNSWIKVRFRTAEGWVAATNLQIFLDLEKVKAITADEIAQIPNTKACVDVVGDSIAHGGAVFEIPTIGFVRAPMIPFAKYLQAALNNYAVKDIQAIDRSVSAVGISSNNHPSYLSTSEYGALLNDHCRFIVIMPWINDLSSDSAPSVAAPAHAATMAALVRKIVEKNPFGHILILNYYLGAPQPFALSGFASGFTPDAVNTFNQQLAAACSNGQLAEFKQVTCIDSTAAFASLGTAYLVGSMTRQQLEAELVSPLTSDEVNMLNAFSNGNPNGTLKGDGVHLSGSGKAALAAYLVNLMTGLPPVKP